MPTRKPTITAHAGAMGYPDNSIEAIQAGIDAGADVVEIDLSFTPQGEPVLSHDEPRGGESTLADAFGLLRRHPAIRMNIDLKRPSAHLAKVQALAEETGLTDRVFFTGIPEEWIPDVRRQCPDIPYYLNREMEERHYADESYYAQLAQTASRLGALGLNIHYGGAHPALSRILHARGLELSLWTVNAPEDIRAALAANPDNITSRRPDIAIRLIDEE
ncbi:MAG: glycerophosphodiester phosphodiesterase [Clostridia bacterium]|nr:glycerophosphodiester phosphodiesterase [Clostridia bacterium]